MASCVHVQTLASVTIRQIATGAGTILANTPEASTAQVLHASGVNSAGYGGSRDHLKPLIRTDRQHGAGWLSDCLTGASMLVLVQTTM